MKLEFDLNALEYLEDKYDLSLADIVKNNGQSSEGRIVHLPTLKKVAYCCYLAGCDLQEVEATLTPGQVFAKVSKDMDSFMAVLNRGADSLPGGGDDGQEPKKKIAERLKK